MRRRTQDSTHFVSVYKVRSKYGEITTATGRGSSDNDTQQNWNGIPWDRMSQNTHKDRGKEKTKQKFHINHTVLQINSTNHPFLRILGINQKHEKRSYENTCNLGRQRDSDYKLTEIQNSQTLCSLRTHCHRDLAARYSHFTPMILPTKFIPKYPMTKKQKKEESGSHLMTHYTWTHDRVQNMTLFAIIYSLKWRRSFLIGAGLLTRQVLHIRYIRPIDRWNAHILIQRRWG